MSVSSTKILYLAMLLLVCLLAHKVDKSKKKSKFPVVIIILLLSLIAGLRGTTVGIDTWTYNAFFEYNNGRAVSAYGITEPIFVYVSSGIVTLFGSTWPAFFFWAAVTNSLVVSRLYEMRQRAYFAVSVSVYVLIYYFVTFNVMRQMIAVAIIFFGTRWLEGQQKILKFVAVVVVAAMIHYSAAVCLIYIPISLLCHKKQLSRAKKLVLLSMALAVPIAFYGFYNLFVTQYQNLLALGVRGSNVGMVIPLKLCVFLFIIIWDRYRVQEKWNQTRSAEYKMCVVAYIIGLAGFLISYFWTYADRVVYYFVIFEPVCYGIWMKQHRRNDVIRLLLIAVLGIYFVSSIVIGGEGSGQGQYPYYFFWMK